MAYDPSLPAQDADILSAELRSQFAGLKDLIDAVPTLNAAVIDSVTPLPPGSVPTVGVVVGGQTLHFSFSLPVGIDSAVIDSVTTLPPGQPVGVGLTLLGSVLHFTFGIPQGSDGAPGATGPPGEVTNASLATAVGGTSNNTNGVGTLDTPFADPDAEALRVKLNEFLLAARR